MDLDDDPLRTGVPADAEGPTRKASSSGSSNGSEVLGVGFGGRDPGSARPTSSSSSMSFSASSDTCSFSSTTVITSVPLRDCG